MTLKNTDKELLKQAEKLKKKAYNLLYNKGLFDLISSVGTTQIIGSFTLDLMTWPDIDISVTLPHEKDVSTFFELGKMITEQFNAAKMSFSNMFIRTDQPYDHGLYWGAYLPHESQRWKIDIWGYGEKAFQSNMKDFEKIRNFLDTSHRLTILRIKNDVCHLPEYRGIITALDIYNAVGKHKIKTTDEFLKWHKNTKNL
jgi:hypothetical protein